MAFSASDRWHARASDDSTSAILAALGFQLKGWKFQRDRSTPRFFWKPHDDRFERKFQVGEGLHAVDFTDLDYRGDATPSASWFCRSTPKTYGHNTRTGEEVF